MRLCGSTAKSEVLFEEVEHAGVAGHIVRVDRRCR